MEHSISGNDFSPGHNNSLKEIMMRNPGPNSPSKECEITERLRFMQLAQNPIQSPDDPLTSNERASGGKGSESGVQSNEESTDSENEEEEPISSFHRKLSTHKHIKNTASMKEGYLMKQTSSFQRWHRRYFKVKGRTLYYSKNDKSQIFDEISLSELTIAESSSKNFKHCFQVITSFRILVLAAESRSSMEEWIAAIRAASNATFPDEANDHSRLLSGTHVWYATSHARPTYCNVCREQLCGVTSNGLSCEICKFKAHKRCASKAPNNCKWTTLASIGKDIIEEPDGTLAFPHQWLEGNLPVSAKCDSCDKTCGSVLRLQDWRCLWCRASVHQNCKGLMSQKCLVGRISVVPPTALHTIGNDDAWEASKPLNGCSPLLVFVNSKSGDHQGVKFLRRFKQQLNPAQVFDLMSGGPRMGLQLFRHFEPFRILVCGGDGSVGWVMSEIDRLDMHKQVMVGIIPLGTGNDLARVLGWGASCDHDAHLPQLLDKYEKSTTKMLDRWSIMTFERGVFLKSQFERDLEEPNDKPRIADLEHSLVSHLHNILQSDQHETVINSAKVLCETVRDMIGKMGSSTNRVPDSEIDQKCAMLSQKLDSLLKTLKEETECLESSRAESQMGVDSFALESSEKKVPKFRQREALMSRANSLKKAVRQIIEHAEKTLDETSNGATPVPVGLVRPITLPIPIIEKNKEQPIKEVQETQSPIDPLMTFPVPTQFADLEELLEEDIGERKVQRDHEQSEKAEESSVKIKVDSPTSSSDSSPCEKKAEDEDGTLLNVRDKSMFPRGASPRTSRRVSMSSLLKPLEVEIPSPNCFSPSPSDSEFLSPFSISSSGSLMSSPAKRKRKTLPIVNPLVSIPSWPAIASPGGIVSKVLLANADTICAVGSPEFLMDPELDAEDRMIGFEERCVMNNYFGIGIDAKISLDFHLKREEHPEKCRSRTKNFMWYGVLGSKELLQKTCKNLEQRVQLECDGKRLPLPSLQGIVILNIQSFMGGTNFWGGRKEDDCFLAPSFDDKILEVVAVFDSMQMAASRLINLQHHRIAQCNSIKISILGDDPIPIQVDGEAWLQPPGVISIIHKNRMQMLCRNRALESSLKSWEEKLKQLNVPSSPEWEDHKRGSKGRFKKIKFKKDKRPESNESTQDGPSDDVSEEISVERWSGVEVTEWLEHMQLGEYKPSFIRHDIRGAELLCLQRRDLKELGVTKIGHLKRILQGIENLQNDANLAPPTLPK